MREMKHYLNPALVITAFCMFAGPGFADITYGTDQGHTEVEFEWSHAGVSVQHGEFTSATGTLNLADDIEKSSIIVVIETASLSTGFEPLDKHLKSKDFLEVETYPEISFQSTAVMDNGDNLLDITGDLTIHGVTKPVTLNAKMTHKGEHPLGKSLDYYKGEWIAFKATTQIDHQAFGVGGFSTGPITIEITTEMKTN